jgi:hypothetical protein
MNNTALLTLQAAFDDAGVTLSNGTTSRVAVVNLSSGDAAQTPFDDGAGLLLGAADFTYQA